MWSVIGSLASSVGGIIALLAVIVGLVAGGAYEEHRIDAAKLTSLELSYQTASATAAAQAAATQKQLDAATSAATTAAATQQAALNNQLQAEVLSVPTYVKTPATPCVPWGFIRVLDATVLGSDPASLPLPAGAANDACSTFSYATVAASIVVNYGHAKFNAAQLTALQAWVKQVAAMK
jgi:hypothetical protein